MCVCELEERQTRFFVAFGLDNSTPLNDERLSICCGIMFDFICSLNTAYGISIQYRQYERKDRRMIEIINVNLRNSTIICSVGRF